MEFLFVMIGIWIATFLLYALIDFVVLALYVIWCLSLSRVFDKFGEESWKSYIPIYNIYIVIKAAGVPVYYMIGCILPLFGKLGWITFYIFIIYISVMLAKKFGKKKKFLTDMMIFPPIYLAGLGHDNSVYIGDYNKNKEGE